MSRSDIEDILKKRETITAVGILRELEKDSQRVSAYLKAHGF